MTYKALNGSGPSYIRDLVELYKPICSLRSADKMLLKCPLTKLKCCGDRSFAKAAPNLWNPLPLNIKCAASTDIFKEKLKTYLFTEAFSL